MTSSSRCRSKFSGQSCPNQRKPVARIGDYTLGPRKLNPACRPNAASPHPATVVRHFKKSKEAGVTHLLHFDDGDIEKVGLPDDETIQFLDEVPRVTRCVCARCVLREQSGRELPL